MSSRRLARSAASQSKVQERLPHPRDPHPPRDLDVADAGISSLHFFLARSISWHPNWHTTSGNGLGLTGTIGQRRRQKIRLTGRFGTSRYHRMRPEVHFKTAALNHSATLPGPGAHGARCVQFAAPNESASADRTRSDRSMCAATQGGEAAAFGGAAAARASDAACELLASAA
jgi:hypothetical protein